MKRLFTILLIVLSCTGCGEKLTVVCLNQSGNKNIVQKKVLEQKPNRFWNIGKIDEFVATEYGNAFDMVMQADYTACLSAQKPDPFDNDIIDMYNGAGYRCDDTRSMPDSRSPYRVEINGLDMESDDATRSGDLAAIYGSQSQFSLYNRAATRSEEPDTIVNMYVPALINITVPAVTSPSNSYPLCYYRDFVIRWNADPQNTCGVVVVIEWTGMMAFGSSNPNAYIRRTDVVAQDGGYAKLEEDIFDGIPDTAMVYITLLRGGVENMAIDDVTYKVMAETHASMPFVLIRNLKAGGASL